MSIVSYKDTVNGPWLIINSDNTIRIGIERSSLMVDEMQTYSDVIAIAKRYKPEYKHVIDGGSNHGTFCVPIAAAHPDLEFHAFEVQRMIYYATCGTIALHGLTNIYSNLCALSDKHESISFNVPNYNAGGNYGAFEIQPPFMNTSVGHWTDSPTTSVIDSITIDSLELETIFIKLDLEGMEYPAVIGATNTIEKFKPVVWCESIKSDQDLLFSYFTSRGYRVITDRHTNWYFIPEWVTDIAEMETAIFS
jgi:FkbM family methyltransferase